ncbi:MAG: pirin family protein [Nocardioidaceae bacterium]|nr:pirin family protein [Nocardioidaceae bacterium]
MSVTVIAAADRYDTRTDWLESRHSFSHGSHYDPDNMGFASLLACNDEVVQGGAGFQMHAHAGIEIVTWVLSGKLVHEDSEGNRGVVVPGTVQLTSAGSGIRHAEVNASADEPVHLVQTWVAPDDPDAAPSYLIGKVDTQALAHGWVPVVGGSAAAGGRAIVQLGRHDAALWVTRPATAAVRQLPDAPFIHLLVSHGMVEVERVGVLTPGDALRCVAAGPLVVTATQPAELLVWELHS